MQTSYFSFDFVIVDCLFKKLFSSYSSSRMRNYFQLSFSQKNSLGEENPDTHTHDEGDDTGRDYFFLFFIKFKSDGRLKSKQKFCFVYIHTP
jgi:hypothetical protein